MRRWLWGCITILLFLCACGRTIISTEQVEKEYYEPGHGHKSWEYPILETEHGEDYVIEWVDKGMEAHVRLFLGKPEGDIYHSDVWDIGVVFIGDSCGYDAFVERPKEDRDYLVILDDVLSNKTLHRKVMYDICSLQDLRHFDSLQIASIHVGLQNTKLSDISGPEHCKNLQVFRVFGGEPESLECISKMENLERLSICDFTNDEALDLTALSNLQNLKWLQLGSTRIESLEPLCGLKLEHLNLLCDIYSYDAHKGLDYSPISQMDSMIYLDLTNNVHLEKEELSRIINNLENLETVEIGGVIEDSEITNFREQFPNIRVFGYMR